MISFVNFARISSIFVGFHLGTLHGYFFHQDFWPNLNFPLECQIKRVLTFSCLPGNGGGGGGGKFFQLKEIKNHLHTFSFDRIFK